MVLYGQIDLKPFVKMAPDTAKSKLTWTTSDKKIATIKNGIVTGKAPGTASITAASDGFSYYTVVFTYTDGNSDSYTYSMSVDERVWLWQMLQALNIEGEPSAVTVESADSAYLTVGNDPDWYVEVNQYFSTPKTLKVTVGETNYSISVKIGNVF